MFHEHYCKREFVRHHQRITSLRITLEVGSLHFISTFLPTGNPLDVEGIWTLIPNMMLRALIPTFSLTIHMYLNANVIVVMKSRETSPFQSKRINVRVVVKFLIFLYFARQDAHTHMCVCIHMLILEGVKIYWAVDGCLSSWSIWVYLVWRTTCKKTCLLDQVLVIYEIDPHFGAPFSFKSKSSLVWLLLKFHLFILKAYTYPPSFQIWLWMMTLGCHLNFGATSHHLAWRMRCQALKKCMRDH